MIKVIAFDLWQTLAYRDVAKGSTTHMLELTKVSISQPEFVKIFENSLQTKKWSSKPDAYSNFCVNIGLQPTKENVNLLMEIRDAAEDQIKLYPYTISLLKQLHEQGYKTALISNSSIFSIEKLKEKTNLLDYIDYPIFSFDVGVIKPDLKIFNALTKTANCDAQNIIMVGDKPGDDIAPAQSIGMNAILFQNYNQLKKELANFSITIV